MNNQLIITFIFLLSFQNSISSEKKVIKLPEPQKEGGMPLYEALNKRQSLRNFNNSIKITPEIISQALWSCYGVNREKNNLRTIPSARLWYPLIIYVFLDDGIYLYDSIQHSLTKIIKGDYRKLTGTQKFAGDARMNILLVADFKKKSPTMDDPHKMRSLYMETGHCAMALGLFAAANNMKGVERAMINHEPLLKLLKLNKDDYIITLAFSLGY